MLQCELGYISIVQCRGIIKKKFLSQKPYVKNYLSVSESSQYRYHTGIDTSSLTDLYSDGLIKYCYDSASNSW